MTGGHEMAGDHESLAGHGHGPGPGDVDLGRVWLGVAAQVWRRRPGPTERAAGRLLRSPGLARALSPARARPKSVTSTRPSRPTSTFSGLKSR